MPYQITTATKKLLQLKKRIRGVAGGTSASKTISILCWLIDYAQSTRNELISVVSETFPHLKKGARRDFINIMKEQEYWDDKLWNATDSIYTFPDGSQIEFFSADNSAKVRGPRRQILFINEANNISYETYEQLEIRTEKIIWLDWNPVSEFWWYEDENGGKGVKDGGNVDFITLTYLDNEALPQSIVQSIESKKHKKNFWLVYGLGQLGEAEGRIYTGWEVIDSIPHEARLERRGLDFGYTNDPSTVVAVYYYNGGYVLDEELYQKGMSNAKIADTILNLPKHSTLVMADSAEPKSIDEIKLLGINILPCHKGKDSVRQGIQFVQDQNILVTKRSLNLLKEYRNYTWMKDKNDKILNDPEDEWNHCLDAVRYAFTSLRPYKEEPIPEQLYQPNDDVIGV